jgi:ABC-type Fe3+ transport system permease subunit
LKEHSEKARKRPGRKVSRFGRIMLALVFVVPWWVVGYVVVKSMDDAGWLWWAHSAWWWLRATVALLWAYLT